MAKKQEKEIEKQDKKIDNFSSILEGLTSVEAKKKQLILEAYQNALEDRADAGILLADLMMQTIGSPATHAVNGPIMTKYLERKSKANDQVLRLIELLLKEQEKNAMSPDDIYDQIAGGG